MTLWFAFAAMTVLAAIGIAWPLWRRQDAHRSGSDVAVYRDQLNELKRDRTLGLIGPAEAEAARIEVSRRLLAASEAGSDQKPAGTSRLRRQMVFAASLAAITLGAGALYLRLGTPSMAYEAARAAPASAAAAGDSVEQLVAQAENYLTHNPRDARAWEVLAPVYMRVGRYSDAANAWRNVIQLSGENADRVANLGEALVAEANGVVTADAKSAFVRATALDPKSVSGRYYLGLAAEQDGRRDEAAAIYRALVADAPPDAHWVGQVRDAAARLEDQPKTLPGPTPSQMLAASKQPPSEQQTMIRGMVARLAARLKQDGSDPDAWARLVRSYTVLGEPDQARAATDDARKALAADPAKLAKLESALKGEPADAAAASPAAGAMEQPDIKAMVARLAARLKQDGSDPDGWAQLVRSYTVLGDQDQARAAAADARKALAGEPDKLAKLETALKADASGAAPAASPANDSAAPAQASMPQHDVGDMVARLAARLKQAGGDPEGWLMLTRSYVTLGDKGKAAGAIRDARQALAADPDKLAQFDESIKRFKLEDDVHR